MSLVGPAEVEPHLADKLRGACLEHELCHGRLVQGIGDPPGMQATGHVYVGASGKGDTVSRRVLGQHRAGKDVELPLSRLRGHELRVCHQVQMAVHICEGHGYPIMAPSGRTRSQPTPEIRRMTSPAIICPMMGGMKLAVPSSERS